MKDYICPDWENGYAKESLEMTHFFNKKQVLMENVLFQGLTTKLFYDKLIA